MTCSKPHSPSAALELSSILPAADTIPHAWEVGEVHLIPAAHQSLALPGTSMISPISQMGKFRLRGYINVMWPLSGKKLAQTQSLLTKFQVPSTVLAAQVPKTQSSPHPLRAGSAPKTMDLGHCGG